MCWSEFIPRNITFIWCFLNGIYHLQLKNNSQYRVIVSLQSRRDFGEWLLSISLTNIMAAIFDFNSSWRLGRERNLYQGSGRRSKMRRALGVGKSRLRLPEVIVILKLYLRQQRRFWWSHIFCWWKKQPHRFTHAGLHQTHYGRLIFKCSRLLLPSFFYDQMEEWNKYQLIFRTAQGVLSKPFLSLLKKNCLTVSLTSSTCVCFCRRAVCF